MCGDPPASILLALFSQQRGLIMALRDESVSTQAIYNEILALVDALIPPVNPDADDFGFVECARQVLISVACFNAMAQTRKTAAAVKPAGAQLNIGRRMAWEC
jgi:hypothetical protein